MKVKKSAFTLVELLVVISIIALLMGILTPALAAARRAAYKTACKQNLHGCAVAFQMYLDDNRNVMPVVVNMPSLFPDDSNDSLYDVLGKYLSGKEALKCPADKNATFFREQGSSYEYNTRLANRRIGDGWFAERFGTKEIFILKDYEPFHTKFDPFSIKYKFTSDEYTESRSTDKKLEAGAVMYLYADSLVADRERNK